MSLINIDREPIAFNDPMDLAQYATSRRTVFETQVRPALQSRVAWLASADSTQPSNGLEPQKLAALVNSLETGLSDLISRAENDVSFGEYHYWPFYSHVDKPAEPLPAAPTFNIVPRNYLEKGANILVQAIEGDIPLQLFYQWSEIVPVVENAGKKVPDVPGKLNEVTDEEGTYITNDRLDISLPTKIPFVFMNYRYLITNMENPQLEQTPITVGLSTLRLDHLLAKYPGHRPAYMRVYGGR